MPQDGLITVSLMRTLALSVAARAGRRDRRSLSPRACCTIFTPALAPTRVAPAATIAFSASRSRTPPAAFTPISAPTTRRISATSAAVAPPGPKPVEVFT